MRRDLFRRPRLRRGVFRLARCAAAATDGAQIGAERLQIRHDRRQMSHRRLEILQRLLHRGVLLGQQARRSASPRPARAQRRLERRPVLLKERAEARQDRVGLPDGPADVGRGPPFSKSRTTLPSSPITSSAFSIRSFSLRTGSRALLNEPSARRTASKAPGISPRPSLVAHDHAGALLRRISLLIARRTTNSSSGYRRS